MPTAANIEIFKRLDELAEQGRQHSSKLELISQKLFGSEEDHFEAGRLPILESRIDAIETHNRGVWRMALAAGGKVLLAALSALGGALFGLHHR